ncbi:MAG: prolyl oligopeptidase family serine peptidase [Anaerolineae bacterium]
MQQRQVLFETAASRQVAIPYLLYLPQKYHQRPRFRWPLMLFLHGAGERGNDLALVKKHGPPKLVEERPLPFVILSPQCPQDSSWSSMIEDLIDLLEDAKTRYRVDPDRVCVTGLSMGGFGTWALAATRPDLVAAIAPICGGPDWFHGFPLRALRLWQMPVWAFHGAKDQLVPPSGSRELVELLQALGDPARLTIYPDADHDSWTATYQNPELYRWLLSQRLGPRREPLPREARLPNGDSVRYWHTPSAGYVVATQAKGLPALTPISREAWDTLGQAPTDVEMRARLGALGLAEELGVYVEAILQAERNALGTG